MIRPMLLLLAALALAACGNAAAPPAESTAPGPAAVPASPRASVDPAAAPAAASAASARPERPGLVVETLAGDTFDLSARRGRWVVVNFWATWCAPCLKEIPDLTAFDRARDDVEVIGLAFEEIDRADLEAFVAKHEPGYPIALVDVYAPPPDFDIPRGLPMTYLVAPDGRVAEKFMGPVTSAQLAAKITAASAD